MKIRNISARRILKRSSHENEIWALIDDNAQIILDGPRYTRTELAELPDDVERDCVTDAIDLGLEALGKGTREPVWNLVIGYEPEI